MALPRPVLGDSRPEGGGSSDASEILRRLRSDAAVRTVRRVAMSEMTPLRFHREFVAGRVPVILTGAIDEWPALQKWNLEYLKEAMGDDEVTVASTPNGRADAVTWVSTGGDNAQLFMRPHESKMPFREFADRLHAPQRAEMAALLSAGDDALPAPATRETVRTVPVLYAQKQNGSFCDEYAALGGDVSPSLAAFGEEVFGAPHDAVNMWMGGDGTVSSMHRDPYENLYAVVCGTKQFTLLPPWEADRVPYTPFKEGMWKETPLEGSAVGKADFTVEALDSEVKWISIEPSDPHTVFTHPPFASAHPLSVAVEEGEVLYLPSLWYHEVGQVGRDVGGGGGSTIAVNYWFDMNYDAGYWAMEAVRRLSCVAKGEPLSDGEDDYSDT
eukprot:Rhum_TRINITY_DN25134_c0_g1::Rhum_TRINITY_DN25134_c0_g1_i1::g.181326::m.181326/K19219/JMJD7; jumonji domain-containing protein 7